jgi:glycerate kinase
MKIVLAPDKFKGSLSGPEFCRIAEETIREFLPRAEVISLPLADGGDGTAEVLQDRLGASRMKATVSDPLFRPILTDFLFDEDSGLAFIEMAQASGYALLRAEERNPLFTTSFGTGELIHCAIKAEAKRLIIGLGGSATNDAGTGMAAALGYRFLDKNGTEVSPVGKNLQKIRSIEAPAENPLRGIQVDLACDVANPFFGEMGAAYVYGPQKGANPREVELLDQGLRSFAALVKNELNLDLQNIPGAGAAGGIGGGAVAFLGAQHRSGIELVKELLDFDASLKDADWVISGEGALDEQSFYGKTIQGVTDSAQKRGVPVAVFCGHLDLAETKRKEVGIAYATSINKPHQSLEEAIANTADNLKEAVRAFVKGELTAGL